jgi:hypothetical protein
MRAMPILTQILVAFMSSGVAFFLFRTAFNPHASVFDPLEGLGDFLAVGVTVLTFCVILYRIRNGTWTREQIDELLGIDD